MNDVLTTSEAVDDAIATLRHIRDDADYRLATLYVAARAATLPQLGTKGLPAAPEALHNAITDRLFAMSGSDGDMCAQDWTHDDTEAVHAALASPDADTTGQRETEWPRPDDDEWTLVAATDPCAAAAIEAHHLGFLAGKAMRLPATERSGIDVERLTRAEWEVFGGARATGSTWDEQEESYRERMLAHMREVAAEYDRLSQP